MKPNTLYLHIGTDKTGSKAIQWFLQDNAAKLSDNGVTYLSSRRDDLRHAALRIEAREGDFAGWREVARELSNLETPGIVSDEGLYHLPQDTWREIREVLSPHRLEVVLYLRLQSEMVCSGIAQLVKSNQHPKPPCDFTMENFLAIGQSYSPLLGKLSAVFGRDHIHVGRYERSRLRNGSLLLDFLGKLGLEIDPVAFEKRFHLRTINPNPTLDVDALEVLARLDARRVSSSQRKEIVYLLREIGLDDRSTFISENRIAKIDAHFDEDNTRVARDWFGEDVLFREPCRFRFRAVDESRVDFYFEAIDSRGLLPRDKLEYARTIDDSASGGVNPGAATERNDAGADPVTASTGESETMIVCCQSPWHPANGRHRERFGEVEYVFNQYHPDAVAVVDVKWPMSTLSAMFPPERRVWVHIEPILLTDYFRDFENYYAGGIVSWHTGLDALPQTRQYRHAQRGGGARDTDEGKIFGVGGHISHKNNPQMDGYRLRRRILDRQNEIEVPSTVFNFQGAWRGDPHDYPRETTDEVMHYMFHLAIENCRERHYFSEKIIRAFANFCLPLYFGDPCVADEFDPGGIILIDETNWLETINRLTPADYYERMESIRRNYFLSMKYWTKLDRIVALVNTTPALRQPVDKGGIYESAALCRSPGTELVDAGAQFEVWQTENGRRLTACNASAAVVYALCDGERGVSEITEEIASGLDDTPPSAIAEDVSQAVRELIGTGAIQPGLQHDAPRLTPVASREWTLEETTNGYMLARGSRGTIVNAPAALVWMLCDGSRTLAGIVDRVIEETGEQDSKAVARDVCQTIMRFADQGQVSMLATGTRRPRRHRRNHIAGNARRPRVLYLLTRFPQLSETYIKTEIAALRDDYDIGIIAFEDSNLRYRNHHPYRVVRVRGNTMSDEIEERQDSLTNAIREFDPDILHTHYLNNAAITARMAERLGIPFTVRAHSYDVLANGFRFQVGNGRPEPGGVLLRQAPVLNAEHCLGVLTFPYTVPAFTAAGVRDEKIIPCYPVVDFSAFYDRGPNREGMLNVEPCLPKKAVTDFIDLAVLMPGHRFSLYGMGHQIEKVREYNLRAGSPVTIEDTVEPEEMPAVYKQHDWLIYTANFKNGNVGWPVAIFEAQAAGLGVCVANVHPHVVDQLGGAGFVYDSIHDIPGIVSRPYPDEMREAGFENARKSDIHRHKHLLTDLWQPVLEASRPGTAN